jgi:hypothetical protein
MKLLPKAYASSLLRQDESGRTLFAPEGADGYSYVVPDIETGWRILDGLKRIRVMQLAAWVLLPAGFVAALVITDGMAIPKWLFLTSFFLVVIAGQMMLERARHRLTRGLAVHAGPAWEPTWLDKVPTSAILVLITAVIGLALYFERGWLLLTLSVAEDIVRLGVAAGKGILLGGFIVGGLAALLWGRFGALRRRIGSSNGRDEPK